MTVCLFFGKAVGFSCIWKMLLERVGNKNDTLFTNFSNFGCKSVRKRVQCELTERKSGGAIFILGRPGETVWEKRYSMKKRVLLTVLGLLLVLGGVGIFFYPNFRAWQTQGEVQSIIDDFMSRRDEALEAAGEDPNPTEVPEEEIIVPDEIEETPSDEPSVTEAPDASDSEDEFQSVIQESPENEEAIRAEIARLKQVLLPDLYQAMLDYNQDLIMNGQHISDAWDYEQSPIDLVSLNDNSSVIGYLEIPDMKVRLPLFLGASMSNLSKGAAVLSQTSMPVGGDSTNCVIAGHRGYQGSAYFQYIDRMSEGSKIYITNPWETLTYQVTGIKIVQPTDSSDVLVQPGKDMVTLVSCHPYVIGGGPERYLVFAERVDTVSTVSDDGEITVVNPPEDTSMGDAEAETPSETTPDPEGTGASEDATLGSDREPQDGSNDPGAVVVTESSLSKLEEILRIVLPIGIVALTIGLVIRRKVQKKDDPDDFM